MAYQINKSDGTALVVVEDGLIDSTTSLKLVGRNSVNYGETQNENFVFLLEHFANGANNPPNNPLPGQLWYNTDVSRLQLYDNTKWNQIPTIAITTSTVTQSTGDFWFNNQTNVLFVKSASGYIRVGPTPGAQTAVKLESPAKINGVDFDGSANITISSTTTNKLSVGNYLTGDPFNGSVSTTWDVYTGDPDTATPFAIVARDSNGDIFFNQGHGISLQARFADLAEKYLTDQEYEVGTVVAIGGTAEVRACKKGDRAIGVVSGNPAFMMNKDLKGGTYIAIKGRVPVKISGTVHKGDDLVAGQDGRAVSANSFGSSLSSNSKVFAVALEDSLGNDQIEALVL